MHVLFYWSEKKTYDHLNISIGQAAIFFKWIYFAIHCTVVLCCWIYLGTCLLHGCALEAYGPTHGWPGSHNWNACMGVFGRNFDNLTLLKNLFEE